MTESRGKPDKARHRLTETWKWMMEGRFQKPASGQGLVLEGERDPGRNSLKRSCNGYCSLSASLRTPGG